MEYFVFICNCSLGSLITYAGSCISASFFFFAFLMAFSTEFTILAGSGRGTGAGAGPDFLAAVDADGVGALLANYKWIKFLCFVQIFTKIPGEGVALGAVKTGLGTSFGGCAWAHVVCPI